MKLPSKKSTPVIDIRKFIFQLYGEPKVGKSTFASSFPNALFICTEPGHKFLSVYGGDYVHKNWEDIKDTLKRLFTEKHDFQTIVFDTIDNAVDMCSRYVMKEHGIDHESDLGYGKGWSLVKKEFKTVIDSLAARNFGLVFISHAKLVEREFRGVKRPYLGNSLSNTAKNYINGLCDFIFYAYMDDDGNRLLRTKATININAGDRSGKLPEILRMDFSVLYKHLDEIRKQKSSKGEDKPKGEAKEGKDMEKEAKNKKEKA